MRILDEHLVKESEDDLRAYASAVIVSLQTERERERQSHKRIFKDAEYRIAELEAKVARRDAELEACIAHVHHTSSSTPEIEFKNQTDRGRMSKEDALAVMETTTARNKLLESEVQELFQKVYTSIPFCFLVFIYACQLHDARKRVASQEKPSLILSPPTSRYIPTSKNSNILPATLRKQPMSTSHEPEMRVTSPHLLDTEDNPIILPKPYTRPSTSQQPQLIQDLGRQIEALASEVDAFQSERNYLAQFISKEKQVRCPTNDYLN